MKRLSMLAMLLGSILLTGCNDAPSTPTPAPTDAPTPAPPVAKSKGRVKAMAPAAKKASMTPSD